MPVSQDDFLDQFQEVDAYEFEQFVANLWELQNWDTYVTKGADDGGIDVIAEQSTPFPKKQVIQVKRYEPSNSVGRPDVQQYASIRQERTDVDTVVVVTTGRFTDGAKEVAKKLNVKLIDGRQLYNLIDALDAFQLAQSYIEPETNAEGAPSPDTEISTHGAVEDSLSITEFNEDTPLKDIPKFLPSLIKLREKINTNIRDLQAILDDAEDAFHEERYFEAVEKYEEANKRRRELGQKIARYDAGLTHTDNTTIDHLPTTETFTTQLAQISENAADHFREAFRIAERAKGLEQLVTEIHDRVDSIEDYIDTGDRLRQRGEIEKAHSRYQQARVYLEDVQTTMEIYQELIRAYDDPIIKTNHGHPQEISLSDLEAKITSRIESKEDHWDIPKVVENATGSFGPRVLTNNSGELFDKDLIEYLWEDEKLEFVFEPPRKGFKISSSEVTEETPYQDALKSGSSFLLVTDRRVLYVAGVDDHDETRSINYSQLLDVTASTEVTSQSLQVSSVDGTKYTFTGLRDHSRDIAPAADYLSNQLG